jgi:hypothetical protein
MSEAINALLDLVDNAASAIHSALDTEATEATETTPDVLEDIPVLVDVNKLVLACKVGGAAMVMEGSEPLVAMTVTLYNTLTQGILAFGEVNRQVTEALFKQGALVSTPPQEPTPNVDTDSVENEGTPESTDSLEDINDQ